MATKRYASFHENIDDYALTEMCIEALQTDGAHHKQWFVEQILKRLLGKERYENIRRSYEWHDGIEP